MKTTEPCKWTESGFVIRRVIRGKPFQVDCGTHDGKRRRIRFPTLTEARAYCARLRVETTNKGTAALSLSDRDRLDAAEARRKLGKVSILEAVTFFLKHHPANGTAKTVAELVAEYLKAPGRRGNKLIERRPLAVESARKRLMPFKDAFGKLAIAEIVQEDVERWTKDRGWKKLNLRHYVAAVRALFGYAMRRKYLSINPAAGIELTADTGTRTPEILTPAQVCAVLRSADAKAPDLVPRLALSFFCGLRPTELTRLDWGNVNLAGGLVTITPETAKMRRQRHVEIPANLKQWLVPYRKESGALWPHGSTTYWHQLSRVLKDARLKALPYDCGRHAFASYHLALHEDPGKTSLQLGHARSDLLFTAYRGIRMTNGRPVTKDTAQEYFNIQPGKESKVIQFARAG